MVAMKGLSWQEHATGVVFGFLREIQQLSDRFPSARFAFAWDSKKSFRRDVYPEYKRRRDTEIDPEMEDLFRSGKPQFDEIRLKVLYRLGFKNNFIEVGLEADDIIAWLVRDYAWEMEQVYIVSADEDLFQLLYDNVSIYNPRDKSFYSKDDFIKEKGIFPDQWIWVKAIAGCTSDNVKGIDGVGEKTVIKYLKDELKPGPRRDKIEDFDYDFNLDLVKLPHDRAYPNTLVDDELNFSEFEPMCLDYGFHSFLKKEPYSKWRTILRGD
jgi:DNA polymerase-1